MSNFIILGKNGNLSRSFQRRFPSATLLGQEIYSEWMENEASLHAFFSKFRQDLDESQIYMLNCVGIVDSKTDFEKLLDINFRFPLLLSENSGHLNYRLVTFGTVMESLPNYCRRNNYLRSKYAFYKEYQTNYFWMNQNTHFQLHTLFGGDRIQTSLFLGQIYQSIIQNREFLMGSGEQLREYHFIDDVTRIVEIFLTKERRGVQTISHGLPHKLGELAKEILRYFDLLPLLKVNAIPTDEYDNVEKYWSASEEYTEQEIEEITKKIIVWMESLRRENAN